MKEIATLLYCVFLILVCFRGSCVNAKDVIPGVEKQGYSELRITDSHYMFVGFRGCDTGDAACVEMTGKNPAGVPTDIVACVGWPFKGVTVRTLYK